MWIVDWSFNWFCNTRHWISENSFRMKNFINQICIAKYWIGTVKQDTWFGLVGPTDHCYFRIRKLKQVDWDNNVKQVGTAYIHINFPTDMFARTYPVWVRGCLLLALWHGMVNYVFATSMVKDKFQFQLQQLMTYTVHGFNWMDYLLEYDSLFATKI